MRSMALKRWPVRQATWLYPAALVLLSLALAGLAQPATLREGLLPVFLVLILLGAGANLGFARKPKAARDPTRLDFALIGVIAVLLSSLYWFRAAVGVSGWDNIGFGIVTGLLWWLPAVAFAVLYRHPGEHWLMQGRKRFLARLGVAAVASLAGLPIQDALHDERALRAERAGLPDAVAALAARTLPEDAQMDFEHVGGVLFLNVAWPEPERNLNYRQLALLRALAGDAGPMQPGGADRLVERVNVDRVRLTVRRDGRTVAHMDWPQPQLERGAQALVIDFNAAELSPLPYQADLDDILRSLPPRFRTGELCSQGVGDRVWIGRCADVPVSVGAEAIRSLERDWNAANIVIHELGRVFSAVSGFRLVLAGHELDIPRDAVTVSFDARKQLPVPGGTLRLQVSDAPHRSPPKTHSMPAPVEILWQDGQWGPGRNHIALWPWQVRELAAAKMKIYLLEVSANGRVHLLLESIDGSHTASDPIILMPGESVALKNTHVRHLGWIRPVEERKD